MNPVTVLGVGVVVRNGDTWLLGLRKSAWGRDTWAWFARDALPANLLEPTRLYFATR
ncbi:hypothetical protein [Paraburkholderia heleia]|uniref:hypothetical protein n=1 Tax=Paraburkholderia heleia TaxID=634127 RepID=UPI002AB74763|nr:hypothetical protein [Paraburkholderia heleia]